MEKIQKTAKVIDTIVKIIFWFLILATVTYSGISLAGIYYLNTTPPAPTEYILSEAVSFGDLRFSVVPGMVSHNLDIRLTLIGWIFTLCVCFFACVVLKIIRNILRAMVKARPFDMNVSKNIKKLSWAALIGGAIISAVDLYMKSIFFHAYDLQHLFLSDKITACTANYSYDCNFLIVFAILYLLAYIFQYGEELQRQSDETL